MPENVENLKRRMGGGVKRTRGEGRMGGECIASNTGWISRLSVYRGYNQ